MNFNHAPYISPYGPPEEAPTSQSGLGPDYAWYEEPTTETPFGNTYYPPAGTYGTQPPLSMPIDPQLSYPYYLESSGFQTYSSQASSSHCTEAPVFDYQTYSPHLFGPQLHAPQPNLGDNQSSYTFGPQYYDPGSSGAYAYSNAARENTFSSPGMSFGTENYDAGLDSSRSDYDPSLRYPLPDPNVHNWLKSDLDDHEKEVLPWYPSQNMARRLNQATSSDPYNLGNWSYNGQPYGEPLAYTPNYPQHAPYIHPSELQEPYENGLQGVQAFDDSYAADQYNTHRDSNAVYVPASAIEYRSYGQKINAPLQVYCINCTAPLPTFGIRCEDCERRRQSDANALALEFCLLCKSHVDDPGNLLCPRHMNNLQAFHRDEKEILVANHICNICYKRDAGSSRRCTKCPRDRYRRLGLCSCGRERTQGHTVCQGCFVNARERNRRRRERQRDEEA